MKKFFVFAVAAVALYACSVKENPYTSEYIPQYTAEGNVLLFATMPEFENADGTKASISSTGAFSWALNDEIDVVYTKAGESNLTYTFKCTNASTGAFEYEGVIADGYAVSEAYYPHGYTAGGASVQHFASLAAAAKGFQMHATLNAGKLEFAHDNAMFKVTVKNVPLFAQTVWINGSSVDISGETGDVEVLMPVIPASSAKLGIGVTDAAWDAGSHNDLISKSSENSAAITAKNLYKLNDLVIGPSLMIESKVVEEWGSIGSGCWWDGSLALHTWNDGGTYTTDFAEQNLHPVNVGGVDYFWFVYPAERDGEEMNVIIHRPGNNYPRLTTKIVPTGSTSYTFGFATGLKKSTDRFMHIAFSNNARGYVYAWKLDDDSVKPFGTWLSGNYLQKVRMWDSDSTPRESYIFDVNGYNPTEYGLAVYNSDGNKFWNNQNKYGNADAETGWVEEYNGTTAADTNYFIPVTSSGDYYIYMWESGVNKNWKEGYDTYLTYVYN